MFENLVKELLDSGLAVKEDIKHCSSEDIASLKATSGGYLPIVYEQYLLKIGRCAGKFMQGTDIFYPSILGLKEDAIELLEENEENFKLPDDAFVFSMHQGYEFLYFLLSDGDDPEIYQYIEGDEAPTKAWDSFTEFLNQSLAQHIQHA